MENSLQSLTIEFFDKIQATGWTPLSTNKNPRAGLYNYGMAVTPKGRLALYGGTTKVNVSRTEQNLISHSEFWYLDFNYPLPEFSLVNLNDDIGGVSRMVLLEGETVCILNNNFKNQMTIVDLEKMTSYGVTDQAPLSNWVQRMAFGVVSQKSNTFFVIGGHDKGISGNNMIEGPAMVAFEIVPLNPAVLTTAESTIPTIYSSSTDCGTDCTLSAIVHQEASSSLIYLLGILGVVPIVFGIIYHKSKRNTLVSESAPNKFSDLKPLGYDLTKTTTSRESSVLEKGDTTTVRTHHPYDPTEARR
jgi:hypothetical protein